MMHTSIRYLSAALLLLALPAFAGGITAVSDKGRRGQAPEIAVGADGSIHVIWLDKGVTGTADRRGSYSGGSHSHQSFTDLYYARSDDGKHFAAPVRVNRADGEVWGFSISKPNVAVGADGVIHVFYPANAVSPNTGKDVASSAYTRSTDGGKSFEPALILNSDPEEDLSAIVSGGLAQAQVFGSMAVSPRGDVYTFWLDTREMNAEDMLSSIYMRTSHDNGSTFGAETRLFLTDACPCCQVTSTIGSDSELIMAARTVAPGHIRTPMVTVSRDRGATFTERVPVQGTPWQIEGCPLKPTALAAEDDYIYTLVHNGAEDPPGLLFSRSTDGGASFDAAFKIHPEAGVSNNPVLTIAGDALVAVWHAKVDGPRRTYARISRDRGATFGPVTQIAAPAGAAAYPAAAAAPDGSVVLVWQQGEQILARRLDTAKL